MYMGMKCEEEVVFCNEIFLKTFIIRIHEKRKGVQFKKEAAEGVIVLYF